MPRGICAIVGDFIWAQEPYRVRRRADRPGSTSSPRTQSRREVLRTPDAGILETGEVDGDELRCAARPGPRELGRHECVTSEPIVSLLRDECGKHCDLRCGFGDR
jgi:hypothetical protein